MKNALLASLAIVSNAAVPTTAANSFKFVPSALNKYDYQKFIDDVESGIKRPGDNRDYGIVVYLKDPTKMSIQHTEIINIFDTYEEMLQIDPSLNITEIIKSFINGYNFDNIGHDIAQNDGLYKQLLVKMRTHLEAEKAQRTELKLEVLDTDIKKKLSDFASTYNLKYDKNESPMAKNIFANVEGQYYTLLNSAKVQKDGRPYIDKSLFVAALNKIVDDEIAKPATIHTVEKEMLDKFEAQVKAIQLPKDFSAKKLKELVKSTDVDKFETVFNGLKNLKNEFVAKQSSAKFNVEVEYKDYDPNSGTTTFNFKTSLNNTNGNFVIKVKTKKYENIAIKIRDKIEYEILSKMPTVKQNTADKFLTDTDFTKFRAEVKAIGDAIKTVPDYDKVSYVMSAAYDTTDVGITKNSKMNIDLKITDSTETDVDFKTVEMKFKINIDRTIDDDFKVVKESIENRNPDSVFLEEAKKPLFAVGNTLSQQDVFEFWKYVKPGHKNIEKLIEEFKASGKEYEITAEIKDNSCNAPELNNRFLDIDYKFKEKNGKQNFRTGTIYYPITESAVASTVEKLKNLKLMANNPVTDKNINSYVNKNGMAELSKLLQGVQKVVDDAKNLPDKIIVDTSPFYIDGKILYTDMSVYRQSDKVGTEVTFKRDISHKFIGSAEKNIAKASNEHTAEQYKRIIDATGDKTLAENLKNQIDTIKNEANMQIDDPNVKTQNDIDTVIHAMDAKMKAVVAQALKSDYEKLIDEAKKIYGDPLPKDILDQINAKNLDLLEKLGQINPKSADIKKVMELLKNFDISKILDKAKMLSNLSKYALAGISGILGVGGLVSLYNALKIWTTNKKMKDIPNNKLKLKSAKKMGFLSMTIGILAIGGSVALLLFVFMIKGGF